ncbi:MAG: tRNA pseudouridine(38-40) synthase TruA [Actinomycetota bacterium]|nr:tRNA pseudouridine(38-40) synthase TruA [Actinomycetota bacterium]
MPVVRLDLSYDGTGFRGYAKQLGHRTVQGELETALTTLLGATPRTSVAGRTDAGVHARGQVVSFDSDESLDLEPFRRSLNGLLGPEIAILRTAETGADFNARFSAKWRLYRYGIDTGPASNPLTRLTMWHVNRPLDVGAMEDVAAAMVGDHDFSSFCKFVEGKSNVRRVERAEWIVKPDRLEFWVKANAFCHQMVRSIVGYTYDVGRGFSDPGKAVDVIASRDRSKVASVAPPHGLVLWEVGY